MRCLCAFGGASVDHQGTSPTQQNQSRLNEIARSQALRKQERTGLNEFIVLFKTEITFP
jgi:hypothetical protein